MGQENGAGAGIIKEKQAARYRTWQDTSPNREGILKHYRGDHHGGVDKVVPGSRKGVARPCLLWGVKGVPVGFSELQILDVPIRGNCMGVGISRANPDHSPIQIFKRGNQELDVHQMALAGLVAGSVQSKLPPCLSQARGQRRGKQRGQSGSLFRQSRSRLLAPRGSRTSDTGSRFARFVSNFVPAKKYGATARIHAERGRIWRTRYR